MRKKTGKRQIHRFRNADERCTWLTDSPARVFIRSHASVAELFHFLTFIFNAPGLPADSLFADGTELKLQPLHLTMLTLSVANAVPQPFATVKLLYLKLLSFWLPFGYL